MYAPILITPPAIKPLTLAEAKRQVKIELDDNDQDPHLEVLIAAVTAHLDGWTGILRRCLCEQTWRIDADGFAPCMRLPLFPVIAITGVAYRDPDGVEQAVPDARYSLRVDGRGAFAHFDRAFAWPSLHSAGAAVSITARYGYADIAASGNAPASSSVPADIKAGMLLLLAHWFEHREAVVVGRAGNAPEKLPLGVEALFAPYRRLIL